jgi:hypothetical protein
VDRWSSSRVKLAWVQPWNWRIPGSVNTGILL